MTTLPDPQNATRDTPTLKAATSTLHIGSSISISSPAQKVWDALINTSTWPSWNGFVPRVTIRSHPNTDSESLSPILQLGTKMTFHVQMDPSKPNPEKPHNTGLMVTEFSAPNAETGAPGRIVWASDPDAEGAYSPSMLVAEREHEVKAVEGGTELRNWENQVGWLVYVVKWMFKKQLESNFELWVEGLKGFVEGQNES